MKHLHRLLWLFLLLALSSPAFSQTRTVTGTVTDEANEPLPGVNIIIKGQNTGTSTNFEGKYSLSLSEETVTLQASFIGYITEELEVMSSISELNIVLKEDFTKLDEVVITGLASSIKRSNLANAISTVSAKDLTGTTNPQTVDNALYGKIAGVTMTANGGAPGGGISVQLRGLSTLGAGSSQPLYIIDGVYVNNSVIRNGRSQATQATGGQSTSSQDDASNRLADLNPDDIESIEVLKGASAAAIYGMRANAGVIIITTKKGQAGKTKISFGQDVGFISALNLLGTDDWTSAKIDLLYPDPAANATQKALFNSGNKFDFEDMFYGETGLLTNTRLSISGGTNKTQFFISGNSRQEEGIIKNTGFDRYSLRANINHKLSDKIDFSMTSNYLRTKTERGFTGNQNNTGASIGYAIAFIPNYYDLNPDEKGNYPTNPYFGENPLALRDLAENTQTVNRFVQSFGLNAYLMQDDVSFLKFTARAGLDYFAATTLVYMPETLQFQKNSPNPGDVIWGKQDNLSTNMQAFLSYNRDINDINLNTQIGFTRLDTRVNGNLIRGQGLAPGQKNVQQAQIQSILGQSFQMVTDLGFVAQQEFNWDDKIIATVGARFDRSTLNATQDKFYFFPKASLAANIANFDFWSVEGISQLKLRVAYGETGGLPQFGNTFAQLNGSNIGGQLGSNVSARGTDPNLTPERAQELEFGVDVGFLGGKATFEATYYTKNVKDLILDLIPAESTGIDAIATNAADMRNNGIELSLGITAINTEKIKWFTKILWWSNKTEITRLDVPSFTRGGFGLSLGQFLIREGHSPTEIVGNPQTSGDITFYGNAQPDFQMSWFNDLTVAKNLSFTMLWHMKQGGENINLSAFLSDLGGTTFDWSDDDDGDGVPNGQDRGDFNPQRFVEGSSYVKLREIGLYYTLPKSTTETAFKGLVDKFKIGISGNNLLLFSEYSSYDPEVSNFGSDPSQPGIEVTPFPSSRRIMFHIQLDF